VRRPAAAVPQHQVASTAANEPMQVEPARIRTRPAAQLPPAYAAAVLGSVRAKSAKGNGAWQEF
jgi:hypothetical protein